MDLPINAILKLSRERRRQLTPEPINVSALVAARAGSLPQQLEAREARVEIDGELPDLVTDRLAAKQIFGNLIENAVKYLSPTRACRIVVSGRPKDGMLRYAIADKGRGIEERDFERIFNCSAAPASRTPGAKASASPMCAT